MGHKKIILDLVMGAAIPIAILSYGPDWGMPNRLTFILAGLIPAIYVIFDVLFISKKFNFITTVIAVTAITQGGISFLKVDGWKYALADTGGSIVTLLMFGGSLAFGKPIVNYFVAQVFLPKDAKEESLIWRMLAQPSVHRMMVIATLVILAENVLRGTGNYFLNLYRVTAAFDSADFITQKRNVDAMTRVIAPVMSIGGMFVAFYLVNQAIERWLGEPTEDGESMFDQIEKRLPTEEALAAGVAEKPMVRKVTVVTVVTTVAVVDETKAL